MAELERNANCRFYQTKRCIAYTLWKQIFEKYSLLYKAGKAMLLSEAVVCRCFPKEVSKKISPISQKSTCAGVSFHCEIREIFKNTIFVQNTSGGCFWSVSCSKPKTWRTVSTVFVTSRYSSYFIWRSYYTNYKFCHS